MKHWNMSPKALEKAFEKYPASKSSYCGSFIWSICGYGSRLWRYVKNIMLPVIEDAAESL